MRQPRNGENRFGGKHPVGHDHPRTNGTNGARPAGMKTRPIALAELEDEYEDEPVDLVALQADDELINALASGLSVSAGGGPDSDDNVSAILRLEGRGRCRADPRARRLTPGGNVQSARRRPAGPAPRPSGGRRRWDRSRV